MDRYASFSDYAEAKRRLFLNQQENDFAVLNFEDRLVSSMADSTPAEKLFFSTKRELPVGIFLCGDEIVYRNSNATEQVLLNPSKDVRLRGAHNLENVMVALAVGVALNASFEAMRKSVSEFQGIEHRLESVAEVNGVDFVNDSKATSVDAAIKALEAFPGNLVLILGGKDKGSDYLPLRSLIAEKVKHLVLIGAASDKIQAALSGICTVLLAPACSSYDMFDNFEQRGQVFKSEVANLKAKHQ
ncbi:MAG: UDP-N-acetylmuramoylalanine--D-glutamate ligase [bacterium]|nr:MAG: UDP-N-acetylmuramoylalanine--D-glutamate ligase [bacterium]